MKFGCNFNFCFTEWELIAKEEMTGLLKIFQFNE